MGSAAIDSGRQRQLLQQAQALISDLRGLPLDQSTSFHTYSRILELAQVVKKLQDTTASIQHDETRAMWEQRGSWLQEEYVSILCEMELYMKQSEELQHALVGCHQQMEELQRNLQTAHDNRRDAALIEEALELKSKLVVAQQELQKKVVDHRDMTQHMQVVVAERDALSLQVHELRKEHGEAAERVERQLEVIQTMMAKNEEWSGRLAGLVRDNASLQQHNATLSSNLEVNSKVVEKLIELNSELMDNLNSKAFRPSLASSTAPPAPSEPAGPNGAAAAPEETHTSSTHAALGAQHTNGIQPSSSNAQAAPHKPQTAALGQPDGGGHATPSGGGGGGDGKNSFTDAFAAFLTEAEAPPRATATSLAQPPPPPLPGPPQDTAAHPRGFLSRARMFISNLAADDEEENKGTQDAEQRGQERPAAPTTS